MIKTTLLIIAFNLAYCSLPIPVFGCEEDYEPVIDTWADDHNCYFTLESCNE